MTRPAEVKDGICYMCTMSCPTKIHVRSGKAVQIDIADHKVAYCPRWKAQLDFIYHPDRLKYPMKRVGERGVGSMARISWDEALDTIAGNLQKTKDKYGAESVVFWIAYTKEPRPYFHRLTHAFGSSGRTWPRPAPRIPGARREPAKPTRFGRVLSTGADLRV